MSETRELVAEPCPHCGGLRPNGHRGGCAYEQFQPTPPPPPTDAGEDMQVSDAPTVQQMDNLNHCINEQHAEIVALRAKVQALEQERDRLTAKAVVTIAIQMEEKEQAVRAAFDRAIAVVERMWDDSADDTEY